MKTKFTQQLAIIAWAWELGYISSRCSWNEPALNLYAILNLVVNFTQFVSDWSVSDLSDCFLRKQSFIYQEKEGPRANTPKNKQIGSLPCFIRRRYSGHDKLKIYIYIWLSEPNIWSKTQTVLGGGGGGGRSIACVTLDMWMLHELKKRDRKSSQPHLPPPSSFTRDTTCLVILCVNIAFL